jgi:hypothetical protein
MRIHLNDGGLTVSLTLPEAKILIEEIGDLPSRMTPPKIRQLYAQVTSALELVERSAIRAARSAIGDVVRQHSLLKLVRPSSQPESPP